MQEALRKHRGFHVIRRLGLGLCLLWLGWQSFPACADIGSSCRDKVCVVTAYKLCGSNKDCCCTYACVDGCCVPNNDPNPSRCVKGTPPPSECSPGDTRVCFPGSLARAGVGECKAGQQSCVDGQWGDCEGYVLPRREACDDKDNDCDGAIDEGASCPCADKDTRACGKGPCAGQQSCQNKEWGPCIPPKPAQETCDGKDEDCDGLIDDGAGCQEVTAAMSEGSRHGVQIWDRNSTGSLRILADQPAAKKPLVALAYRPDGGQLATASEQPTVRLWDPDDGSLLQTLDSPNDGHKSPVVALAYSTDGKLLATGDRDGEIRIWSSDSGQLQFSLKGEHKGAIRGLIFIDGFSLIAAASDGTLVFWDASTGTKADELKPKAKPNITQIAVSPDGAKLAVISGKELEIWDVKSRKSDKIYTGPADFVGLAYSHQSNSVLTATVDEIQRWDLDDDIDKPGETWGISWARLDLPRGLALQPPIKDKSTLRLALIGTPTQGSKKYRAIFLLDLDTKRPPVRLRDALGTARAVTFRP